MKAILEIPVPVSCKECRIAFFYADANEADVIGCGYLNCDVTEYEDRRAPGCPLKIIEV